MNQSAGVLLRWSRAALLAGVAMTAGSVAHVEADGLMPGPFALLVILACLVTATALFLGRPATRLRLVLLLVAGQTFVHGTLTALSGHRGDPPLRHAAAAAAAPMAPPAPIPAGGGRRVGSLMDQLQPPTGRSVQLSVPYPIQHLIADLTGAHALMALAHLAAAIVVGLWLAKGERAFWALLELGSARASGVLRPALDALCAADAVSQRIAHAAISLTRGVADVEPRVAPQARAVVRSRPRRGPPVPVVA
jgi:hypothetical protein